MDTQDAVMIAVGTPLIVGLSAIVGSVLSKRMSSTSEDQNNLNNSFRLFMDAQAEKYDDLTRKHEHCEVRVGLLQGIIRKLFSAIRQHKVPIPALTFPEQMLLLEDLSFENKDALNGMIVSPTQPAE